MKTILRRIFYYLSVPKCVHCGERLAFEEQALCMGCLKLYNDNKTRNCSKCSHLLHRCSCSTDSLDKNGIKVVFKLYRYITGEDRSPSGDIIFSLKNDNRRDVFEFLSGELSECISHFLTDITHENTVIVNVPRRRSAIRYFGYDHASVLAKAVAEKVGASYLDLLRSNAKQAQKELTSEERTNNVVFSLKNKPSLKGKRVIILDDIITSGASLGEAAKHIKSLGTRKIYGAAVAIAYKDDKVELRNKLPF